ncbi:peptidyl-alpha-hydroxyglycine alpha-amidating lyase family protein [Rugosimonospora acidiphila]|uniref:Peptidyl-alpha-hydroxyglycine alpha-amidating lyase family protein n=1 Tax=Rugosimonospora acidiphila TaxID=556531 RepID=A0ABP9SHY8_9ACTN
MAVVLGQGSHTYRVEEGWGTLPEGWDLGDVAGTAVDAQDRVYVFNRGEHPMIVFDRDGNFLNSWGEGFFPHAHGVFIAPDQTLYCTDDGRHTMTRHDLDGTLLMSIGVPGEAAGYHSGEPFNRCTHTALSPEGDIYVSDGYGNARVHKFSPDGRLLLSWGANGMASGEFNLPHNIVCDADGWVYVADRENHRIQIFDGNGRFEACWRDVVHRPCALYLTPGPDPVFLVGELGPSMNFNRGAPNLGPRLSVLSTTGSLISRLEVTPAMGLGPGQFISPHGIATDSRGDIYVAEVSVTGWPQLFPGKPMPRPIRSLQKLVRVEG